MPGNCCISPRFTNCYLRFLRVKFILGGGVCFCVSRFYKNIWLGCLSNIQICLVCSAMPHSNRYRNVPFRSCAINSSVISKLIGKIIYSKASLRKIFLTFFALISVRKKACIFSAICGINYLCPDRSSVCSTGNQINSKSHICL